MEERGTDKKREEESEREREREREREGKMLSLRKIFDPFFEILIPV